MPFIRTVRGDLPPDQLGLTFSHEHVVIEESFPTLTNPDFILNDVSLIGDELIEFYKLGGRTLVDTMPADCGRNILKLAEVSGNSKVNILAATGIHLEKYYPPGHWRYHLTTEKLTNLFISDITEGIDEFDYGCPVVNRTAFRAGFIKLATGDEKITAHQEKIFEAVVNAHLQTGAPILTHTNNGQQAMEQVELFSRLGADLNHIVLSHVDGHEDLAYHKELLQTGVYVEYDKHFRWKKGEKNWTYILLENLLPQFSEHIVVGMDMARNTYWKSYGGKPGLNFLLTTFKTELELRDLSQYFEKLFFTNPQKLFTFKNS